MASKLKLRTSGAAMSSLDPITVWIDGAEYVEVEEAARQLFYHYQSVRYWIKRAKVRSTKYENRRLVCLTDCRALEEKKQSHKAKSS